MKTDSFYGGRAWRRPLPVLRPPWGADAPRLKRLALDQGELAQFHDSDFPVRYIASLELRPGIPRANHYHLIKREYIYLVGGEVMLRLEDHVTHECAAVRLEAGDLAFVDTGIAHVLEPVAAGIAIEFSQEPFEATDTYKCVVRAT